MCSTCTSDPKELETCSLCLAEVPLLTLRKLVVRDRVTGKALDTWDHACLACRLDGTLAPSPVVNK